MAFNRFAILIGIAMILLPSIATATEYIVGDSKGWTNSGFDYQAWAKDKMFNVGDTLVFKFDPSKHDVYSVNGTAFKECLAPSDAKKFTTGNDTVVLKTAGNKWYLCSKPGHCDNGQKLSITVMDMNAPAASPPSAAAGGIIFSAFRLIIAAFALLLALH